MKSKGIPSKSLLHPFVSLVPYVAKFLTSDLLIAVRAFRGSLLSSSIFILHPFPAGRRVFLLSRRGGK